VKYGFLLLGKNIIEVFERKCSGKAFGPKRAHSGGQFLLYCTARTLIYIGYLILLVY
jgi:hypothetical protein